MLHAPPAGAAVASSAKTCLGLTMSACCVRMAPACKLRSQSCCVVPCSAPKQVKGLGLALKIRSLGLRVRGLGFRGSTLSKA